MESNPYAPPVAPLATPAAQANAPLWNPGAAASWSLLFSPAFGAFLHMRNWQALGDTAKANQSRNWFIGSIVLLVVAGLSGFVFPEAGADVIGRAVGFGTLIAWYLTLGKQQVELVKTRFGTTYPRRSFLPPIGVAIGIFAAVMVAVFLLVFSLTAATE